MLAAMKSPQHQKAALARALSLSPAQRKAIARKAARARWDKVKKEAAA